MRFNGSMVTALLAITVLSALGGVLALWYENLYVDVSVETGEVDWEIIQGSLSYFDDCDLPEDGDPESTAPLSGDDWNVYPNGSPPWAFPYDWTGTNPVRTTKDVGCVEAQLLDSDGDTDMDTVEVEVFNAYPFYYVNVDFDVRNNGTVPIKIRSVSFDLNCDGIVESIEYTELNEGLVEDQGIYLDFIGNSVGTADETGGGQLLVWWGNNFGVQLEPFDDAGMSLDMVVLQEAEENSTYRFCIYLQAVQWNEYSP
ncbi:MAG: hypothetical protein F7B20_01325 [Aeropyrum sp.]|nr:hypothetical protein [Aeropyrum sp.]